MKMASRSLTDILTLPNKVSIPQEGFGVYQSPANVCVKSCLSALKAGYRHIDTAQYYGNESEVGQAVLQSGITRKNIFLTTKILGAGDSASEAYQKCLDSVEKLDPESHFVDLFLIHSPNCGKAERKVLWQALEKLHQEGRARSIGVSNFGIQHIEEMKQFATVWPPHVNQIEVKSIFRRLRCSNQCANVALQLHPWLQQREIVKYCQEHEIIIEAYCPLVRNTKAQDPTLNRIADKHGVTPSQVLIRYCLQKGWAPLPKSDNSERIKANADVYNFDLDTKDMDDLDGLDQGDEGAIVQAVDN